MYKIIGTDGKEYGPLSADQIHLWISENRVERQTPVFVDGAKDWNFLGLLPEFAGYFSGATPTVPAAIVPPGQPRKTHSFATTGLVCGILSVTLCACCGGLPFNVLGLIFSILALLQINEKPQAFGGRGLAIAGIILSAVSFLIFLVLLASGQTHANFNKGQFLN